MGYSQIVDMDVYGDGEEGGEDDMTEEEFRAMLAEVYMIGRCFLFYFYGCCCWLVDQSHSSASRLIRVLLRRVL